MTVRIGIIGSGPAGLTTALALERATKSADVHITLLDRNHSDVDYPGVEYGIQARACRALDRLGVKGAALTVGHPQRRIVLHMMRTAKDQMRIRVDPQNTYGVHRPEFLENLSKLLRRTEIVRNYDLYAIEALERGRVHTLFHSGSGSVPQPRDFDILIACDGLHSLARRTYFPAAKPIDRGFSAVYLLAEGDPTDPRTPESFPSVANGGASEIVMGNFSTNALFPLGRHRLAIALTFDHPTGDRLWREHGLAPDTPWQAISAASKHAIAHKLAGDTPVHDCLMGRALELINDWNSPQVYLWPMRDSDPLPHPYATDCNVVLVGDSCHAFLPTIGMGASLAIEDAELLGFRLGHYLCHAPDILSRAANLAGDVFEPWARKRRPHWDDLMRRARGATKNWTRQGERRRFDLAPYVPTRMASVLVGAVERATVPCVR